MRMKHLASGAVDYVCFLSEHGDKFPDTGHIRKGETESDSRSFLPPKDDTHFGALAGQQELLVLNQLGFDTGTHSVGARIQRFESLTTQPNLDLEANSQTATVHST